jgi:GAF domain-containing protein
MANLYSASRERLAFDFVEQFRDSVFQPSIESVPQFFHLLARVTARALSARHVNIWDNNVYGQCLVHLASYPEMPEEHYQAYQTLSLERSVTGLAVKRCDVVVIPNLSIPVGGRRFVHEQVASDLGVNRLVAIPVFNVFDSQLVMCVVNLLYGPDDIGPFDPDCASRLTQESAQAIDWLAWSLGTAIHYLMLRSDKIIRAHTEKADAKQRQNVEGLPSTRWLFRNILPHLQSITRADEVTVFLCKSDGQRLVAEESTDHTCRSSVINAEGSNPGTYQDQCLLDVVKKAAPLIAAVDCTDAVATDTTPEDCSRLAFMAMPILTRSGDVLGVIRCTNARRQSFSSYDVFAVESFARELAPYLERLLRLREDSMFSSVIRQVFAVIAGGHDLERILQEAIDTLVNVLRAETGSIYLLESDNQGGEHLVMRAGASISKPMVGKATYRVGEGITGTIAAKKTVVRFNAIEGNVDLVTLNWRGKYDREIWQHARKEPALSYLGVPILRGGEVLGVWKVENIERTDQHPDPYFTQEDGQMALIVSAFLAYVISNQREHNRSRQQLEALADQSIRLANSMIKIEEKHSEPEAIRAVLEELKDAGWHHAMVSLYHPETDSIRGEDSSWPEGELLVEITDRPADGPDILACVLRDNQPVFIPDSLKDPRCDPDAIELCGIRAQFVIPLAVAHEKIGTIQIGLNGQSSISEDDYRLLLAFAKHLTIAISRIRSIRRASELMERIVASARFVAAEEISALTVHSLKHRLNDILKKLDKELVKPDKRQNATVLQYLEDWRKQLAGEKESIDKILSLVKGTSPKPKGPIDLHAEIQATINLWVNYLHDNNCRILPRLFAPSFRTTFMSGRSFSEILAVLLVNAVQAHSHTIEIRTSNEQGVRLPEDVIAAALCVDVVDDGHGLGGLDREEIFKATFTTKPENMGTGLGLFMARQLARSAGGDLVTAPNHSKPKGVTFRLIIPLDL